MTFCALSSAKGMDINMKKNLKELEKKIGYEFQDFSLLEQAMMHSSYTNEKHLEKYHCNERLEFLGELYWSCGRQCTGCDHRNVQY